MTVKETAAFLRQHDNYLILTHKRPRRGTPLAAPPPCARGCGPWAGRRGSVPTRRRPTCSPPYLEGRLAPEGLCSGRRW